MKGENGTPFGQAIQDVLEKTLELARELGFQTYIDPEGYYGYAEIGQGGRTPGRSLSLGCCSSR